MIQQSDDTLRTYDEHDQVDFASKRVNADNSSKKMVVIFWGIFALLLFIIFITSNYTPTAFIFKSNRSELQNTQHKNCINPVNFENSILVCQQFNALNPRLGLIMRHLSPLNQFAQINLVILPISQDIQPLQIKQTISFELMSLKKVHINSGNQSLFGFQKGQNVKGISNVQFQSKKYKLQQVITDDGRVQLGYQINLGYYRQFKTEDALLVATFINIDWQLLKDYKLVLVAVLMNDNYTKFIMIMRGIFLGIMTLTTAFFLKRLKFRNNNLVVSEQSIVIKLSVAIILFNDPYYFIGVFKPNIFSIFIQTLFISLFFMMLFSCWIYFLQKINAESRGEEYKINGCRKWINIIAAIDCFIIIFVFNYQIGYYAFTDSPIVPTHKVFSSLLIVILVFFSLVFAYIFYLYIKIFQVWKDIIWRHKLYATFNIFFLLLVLIFISLGWFSLYDQSSQKFQILYASMNIYVIYMQFMYTRPFGGETKQHLHQEFSGVEDMSTQVNQTISVDGPFIDLDKDNEKQAKYSGQKSFE